MKNKKTLFGLSLIAITMTIGLRVLADCYGQIDTASSLNTCGASPCDYTTWSPDFQSCGNSSVPTGYTCNTSTNTYVSSFSKYINGTCDFSGSGTLGTCSAGSYVFSGNMTNSLPALTSCGG